MSKWEFQGEEGAKKKSKASRDKKIFYLTRQVSE